MEVFDVLSLYPNIATQYKIQSPSQETPGELYRRLKKEGRTNEAMFVKITMNMDYGVQSQ